MAVFICRFSLRPIYGDIDQKFRTFHIKYLLMAQLSVPFGRRVEVESDWDLRPIN